MPDTRFYCSPCDAIHPERALALLIGPVNVCPECFGAVTALEEKPLRFAGDLAMRAIHGGTFLPAFTSGEQLLSDAASNAAPIECGKAIA